MQKKYLPILVLILALAVPATAAAQQANSNNADQIEQFALELLSTKSETERNLLLAARKDLVTTDLRRELVRHANQILASGEYSSALSIYSMVRDISQRIGDREGSGTASINIGTVNYFQGHYVEAVDQYRNARTQFLESGNQSEAARALFGLGLALQEQHELPAALEAFERALKEFRSLNENEEIANTLTAIGSIQYSRGNYAEATKAFLGAAEIRSSAENLLHIADALYMQGEYAPALGYYEKALNDFRGDAAIMVSGLGSAANCYYYQGNYDRALEFYQKALSINRSIGDFSGAATQLQGMGNVYRVQGDFGAALDSYLKSLKNAEQSSVKISTAGTIGGIGLVRALQGENALAIEHFQKSLAQFEATGDQVGMARMLSLIGNVYFLQSNFAQALDSFRKSLALRESMSDKTNAAHNLSGIGTTYLAQGDQAQALENYDKALLLYESTGNQSAVADLLTKISDAQLLDGKYELSLQTSQRATDLAKQIESPATLWYGLTESAKAQKLLNRPEMARTSLVESISVVDSLQTRPVSGEAGGVKSGMLPYLALLDLEIDQNHAAEAFRLSERAKTIGLGELIARLRARISKGLTLDEQNAETALTNKLISLGIQIERQQEHGSGTEASLAALKKQQNVARVEYETLVGKLGSAHPDVRINRGALPTIGFDEAGSLLRDAKQAFLEFAITENNTYLFVLSEGDVPSASRRRTTESSLLLKAYPLNITGRDLKQLIRKFNESLISRDEGVNQPARELYDLLLKPAAPQLAGKTSLTIIPDGILWTLSFEALQPVDNEYLIEQTSVSYAPSISTLREMRRRNEGKKQGRSAAPVLGFGSPTISGETIEKLNATYSGQKPDLSNTVGESELQGLKSIYAAAAEVIRGSAASPDQLKSDIGPRMIFHLAAPVVLDDSSPMYSTAILSPGKSNSLFPIWELLRLNSESRLAVMPSTLTVRRDIGSGTAIIATSWAWFVAGTPTIVLGRWPVESGGRAQLMIELHRRLKAKRNSAVTTADALRLSVLSLRRNSQYRHPYYWSGFAVIGDGR